MYALLGVGFLAAASLLFGWSFGQFRHPQPKAWARSDFAAASVTLVITCLFAFALACLGNFLVNLDAETPWIEVGLMAGGALLLCWFLVPRLMAPGFLYVDAAPVVTRLAADSLPDPANDPQPAAPAASGRRRGKSGKKRAA